MTKYQLDSGKNNAKVYLTSART